MYHNKTTLDFELNIKTKFYEAVLFMVSKTRVVNKINFLEIILGNFKRPWIPVPQGINVVSFYGLSYPIHPKFKLLPLPHASMNIHSMACSMKCDWLATFLPNGWSLCTVIVLK